MTKEDIVRMAKEAGFVLYEFDNGTTFFDSRYERFAALVASVEREACAELCEYSHDYTKGNFNYHATLIRERGQA